MRKMVDEAENSETIREAATSGRGGAPRRSAKSQPNDDAQGAAVTMEDLIAGLNEDLSWEFNAVITYRLFASLCTGPYRQELRQFFEAEIPDELLHAQLLADKIVALGGKLVTVPAPVQVATDNRGMLELALEAERNAIRRYKRRAAQADALDEVALKVQIEDLIVDETRHAEEMERILTDWKT